jgi:hypothetical protein
MAAKRHWATWPSRFAGELNGTSGLAGAGGAILTGLSFGGLTAASGALALVTGGLGIILMAGAVVAAGAKSLPVPLVNPADIVGEDRSLDQLNSLEPKIFAVGIVGPSHAGKSTLASRILHQPGPTRMSRTHGIHCYVAALQTGPVKYVAMVDGPGDKFAMQFSVVENSQIVYVILDHNAAGNSETDQARIAEHHEFQRQLREYLAARSKRLVWVHLLLNKRDLWERKSHGGLLEFLTLETEQWAKSNLSERVTFALHSNEFASDIDRLLADTVTFLGKHKPT